MSFRFDVMENPRLCVEYLLIRRVRSAEENGVLKDFAYVGVVGEESYLSVKKLKMVYTEPREAAINLIASSLCEKESRFVIFSNSLFCIDPKNKMTKSRIRFKFFINKMKVCDHIKSF